MYEFSSRVRYSEIGPDMEMNPIDLVARMQDCCVFHSMSIGRGPKVWLSEKKSWMITAWHVRIFRLPRLGERITTRTWAYRFTRCTGERNFTVRDENGGLCADANSRWVYFDLEAKVPTLVPPEESEAFGTEKGLDFSDASKRIALPKEGLVPKEPFPVSARDIDTNHHVNNLRYIEMAKAYVPEDTDSRLKELRVEYLRQCRLGDVLTPRIAAEDNAYYISLDNCAGEPCAIVEFMVQ